MEFRVLGPLMAATADDVGVEVGGARQRRLLGTLVAHLLLGALGRGLRGAAQPQLETVWSTYADARSAGARPALEEVLRYAGIEVLRRTVGAARVDAVSDEDVALDAIALGQRLVLDPPRTLEQLAARSPQGGESFRGGG